MHPIIYDVAVSIDGYIAGPFGDVSKFAHEGPVVADYQARLAGYAMAVMGRETYEFAYQFGMRPGDNPYGHMRTIVFSRTMQLPSDSAVEVVPEAGRTTMERLKQEAAGPIYLCGGGDFAGHLLTLGLIDRVRLKRAPILLGGGTSLFANARPTASLRLEESISYDAGTLFQDFVVSG